MFGFYQNSYKPFLKGLYSSHKRVSPIIGTFSPSDLSDLTLWLQPSYFDGIITPDANIGSETWVDQSKIGNNASATGSSSPIYRKGVLGGGDSIEVTNASTQYMAFGSNINITGSFTILSLMSVANDSLVLAHSTENVQVRRDRSSENSIAMYCGQHSIYSDSTTPVDHSDVHLAIWRYDSSQTLGTRYPFRVNKTNIGLGVAGSLNFYGTFNINRICFEKFGTNYNGQLGELLVYNDFKTDSECDMIYDYLAASYTFS